MEELNVMEPSDGNKFYQCTVVIDGENPDNGKPKKYKEVHLVESCSPSGVEKKLGEQMSRTMYPWRVTNIAASKIQFVY